MAVEFEIRYAANPDDFKSYDTEKIGKNFSYKDIMPRTENQEPRTICPTVYLI
jgi:hypothetical protein